MPCKLCGDVCRCSSDVDSVAEAVLLAEGAAVGPRCLELNAEAAVPPAIDETAPEGAGAWRQELSVRLNRYQARRKPKPPRYPSLRLRFEPDEHMQAPAPQDEVLRQRITPTVSNQALALNHFEQNSSQEDALSSDATADFTQLDAESSALSVSPAILPAPAGKLLEFPRSWVPSAPRFDELAEPVTLRPRILEAPEIAPPPPALGGITIEPTQRPAAEKRLGIDIPLQTAPLGHRISAAVIDSLIIALACTVFGCVFWKITAIRPPKIQIVGFLAGLAAALWAGYQYLLVVYAGTTPGLRLMHLRLSRFDGGAMGRRLRRWRVLASFLSAISLGMGYVWVFLDEDSLCWHDRITHSYLAPAEEKAAATLNR